MISIDILDKIDSNLNDFITLLNREFNILGFDTTSFRKPIITFDLRGQVAGTASFLTNTIQLNKNILLNEKYTEDMITNTLAHELAHMYTSYLYYNNMIKSGIKPKSHGLEWKAVMRIMGFEPTRTHNYVVKKARRTYRIDYSCECKTHSMTKKQHSNYDRGYRYKCNHCEKTLEPVFGAILTLI